MFSKNKLRWGLVFVAVTATGCYVGEVPENATTVASNASSAISMSAGTNTPGPINPIPTDLWKPATGKTPTSGSYVYLESEIGDPVGGGLSYLYTPSNATLTLLSDSTDGGHITFYVSSAKNWTGEFKTKDSLKQFQQGYYPGMKKYPTYYDPLFGGLDWFNTNKCTTLAGWFTIDNITYTGSTISSIDLRFEQTCSGYTASLHGKIHWSV